MRRAVVTIVASIQLCGGALAGSAYVPPKVSPAKTVEAPAELRAAATELLHAVTAKDVDGIGKWLAPKLSIVTGTLDLSIPRGSKLEGPWESAKSQVADLGNSTGGDWDLPPNVDIGAFLTKMELDFIGQSLTDGQPWGTDAAVKGAICTYALGKVDPAAVRRAARALDTSGDNFVGVKREIELFETMGENGTPVGKVVPGLLFAIDYDAETSTGWTAFHLPEGGVGFGQASGDDFDRPYASGLCFKQQVSGEWVVVAQASTGL
ncbi:hypothetical protein VW23_005410 [Devosia insulae DS-56]|uniref:Uncharacterized protein n=1 Tax=Devosia insulae DS-56 TaxID=1116389 RepID=A0A1E5XI58_9HYPH|nr:hypothetical protein [Devosia insulae]OEO28288.1 hypothetical protein VW23_005410 [Devosia insulae DS-56]